MSAYPYLLLAASCCLIQINSSTGRSSGESDSSIAKILDNFLAGGAMRVEGKFSYETAKSPRGGVLDEPTTANPVTDEKRVLAGRSSTAPALTNPFFGRSGP
ncbi:hypothetical protein RvY_16424 [Ramazzottius varieornatus]|uniref:Attacin C-terminal domain-containing protein n=1 Tax=Ramazzottius varieornatus TaxID=947166 RepID=A0A1D1W5Y6_RAMVA|nr:hypothetical protein RvY_16424 [Ramazzottius varieornatus]